jgi:hypothetical protein
MNESCAVKEEDPVTIHLSQKAKEPFCEEDPDPGPCRMEVSTLLVGG